MYKSLNRRVPFLTEKVSIRASNRICSLGPKFIASSLTPIDTHTVRRSYSSKVQDNVNDSAAKMRMRKSRTIGEASSEKTNEEMFEESDDFVSIPNDSPEIPLSEAPFLHPKLLESLKLRGYTRLFPVQAETIFPILEEIDNIVVRSKTGSGKTLAYALPIIHSIYCAKDSNELPTTHPIAYIIVPVRELAIQTAKLFEQLAPDIAVAVCIGGGTLNKQKISLEIGKPNVVIGTPGRLLELVEGGRLFTMATKFLVLDEVDRILQQGMGEDVSRVIAYMPKKKKTLFWSATVPKWITEIVHSFGTRSRFLDFQANKDLIPEGLTFESYTSSPATTPKMIKYLLEYYLREPSTQAILYFNTQQELRDFQRSDALVGAFHDREIGMLSGDVPQHERTAVFDRFVAQKQIRILLATDVAARGLDVNDLALVVHVQPPQRADTFLHRSGRTGRAGRTGRVITLVDPLRFSVLGEIGKYIGRPLLETIRPLPVPVGIDGVETDSRRAPHSSTLQSKPLKTIPSQRFIENLVTSAGLPLLDERAEDHTGSSDSTSDENASMVMSIFRKEELRSRLTQARISYPRALRASYQVPVAEASPALGGVSLLSGRQGSVTVSFNMCNYWFLRFSQGLLSAAQVRSGLLEASSDFRLSLVAALNHFLASLGVTHKRSVKNPFFWTNHGEIITDLPPAVFRLLSTALHMKIRQIQIQEGSLAKNEMLLQELGQEVENGGKLDPNSALVSPLAYLHALPSFVPESVARRCISESASRAVMEELRTSSKLYKTPEEDARLKEMLQNMRNGRIDLNYVPDVTEVHSAGCGCGSHSHNLEHDVEEHNLEEHNEFPAEVKVGEEVTDEVGNSGILRKSKKSEWEEEQESLRKLFGSNKKFSRGSINFFKGLKATKEAKGTWKDELPAPSDTMKVKAKELLSTKEADKLRHKNVMKQLERKVFDSKTYSAGKDQGNNDFVVSEDANLSSTDLIAKNTAKASGNGYITGSFEFKMSDEDRAFFSGKLVSPAQVIEKKKQYFGKSFNETKVNQTKILSKKKIHEISMREQKNETVLSQNKAPHGARKFGI